jgi:glycosylphosphatidylinositol transamidase (GPIT) subunit GPI8
VIAHCGTHARTQDTGELAAEDLWAAIREARALRRFREMLLVLDTCESQSVLQSAEAVDGVAVLGSSALGENSYARPGDSHVSPSLWRVRRCIAA